MRCQDMTNLSGYRKTSHPFEHDDHFTMDRGGFLIPAQKYDTGSMVSDKDNLRPITR